MNQFSLRHSSRKRPRAVAGVSNYRRREPEKSLLHETVRAHLKTGPPTAPARLPAPAETALWQDDVPELQQSLR